MPIITDVELMKRFWGNDQELGSQDKFLRNYILMEGWKDKAKMKNFENKKDKID